MKRSRNSLVDLCEQLELLIRKGQKKEAQQKLKALSRTKVPRDLVLRMGALARRAQLPEVSIRLLNPIVRDIKNPSATVTDAEKAQYAASLNSIGATMEARDVLRSVDPEQIPESLLYLAFAHFSHWEYAEAVPSLKKFIQSPKITDYQRLVGKINLASSYTFEEQLDLAESTLDDILTQARAQNLGLIYGNALEIKAQVLVWKNEYSLAHEVLGEAEQVLKSAHGLDDFLVRKWKTILKCLQEKGSDSSLREMELLRNHARRIQQWETVRDCDFFEAKCTFNREKLLHLYFGTPYASYRRRLTRHFPEFLWPAHFDWYLGKEKKPPILNVERGSIGDKLLFDSRKLPIKALAAVSSDFYRPQTIAALYAKIYPEEYFNPESSPNRVHQIINRVRNALKPIRAQSLVQFSEHGYSMQPTMLALRVSSDSMKQLENSVMAVLGEHFGTTPFSAGDAAKLLQVSDRTALRILTEGLEKKELERMGPPKGRRYFFTGKLLAEGNAPEDKKKTS